MKRWVKGNSLCGIFGCVLRNKACVGTVLDGLKRLEYRGYDSMGVAVLDHDVLQIRKDAGRIADVADRVKIHEMKGTVGIGHTRWATHGAPNVVNAHPHTDSSGRIAVIHNGVIENFMQLKQELIDRGHSFLSRTDTEVIPHLIEEEMKGEVGLAQATLSALRRLKGSYAVAVISSLEPGKIVCARHESPLVLGISENGTYCASDAPAIRPFTNKVVYMRNGELATIDLNGFEIVKISDGSPVERAPEEIAWTLEMAEKNHYPHYMLKEIFEQPLSLRNGLRLQEKYVDLLTVFLDRGKEVFLVSAGTSQHSCIAASYIFSKTARLTTYPVVSSEFIESYGSTVGIDSIMLAVSQSGETYDTLKAVEHARMKAATVLGLTNTVGSTLTRVSRAYIIQQSGPEIGVAATKTFTSQVLVLAQLALKLARLRGKLSQDELDEYSKSLKKVPDSVEDVLHKTREQVKKIAAEYRDNKLFLFLGRGISSATAMEARLKLLEITYVPSLSYPAGESKHGPISIVEKDTACVFICPRGETHTDIIGSIMEMKARGADIISVCEEGDEQVKELSDTFIEMPKGIPELLSPIAYVVPMQLLAYELAVLKGLDPDKPRNLAKSVTVP